MKTLPITAALPVILRLVGVLVCCHCAADDKCADRPRPRVSESFSAEPDRLLDSLASSNSPFIIEGKPGRQKPRPGTIYDKSERERVNTTVERVVRQVESIWPELVNHLGDPRYCKTVGVDTGYPRNLTIGDMCRHIIGEHLSEAYYQHMPGSKEVYHHFRLPSIARDPDRLRTWCVDRKHKNLYELQIEMCKWAVGELRDFEMDEAQKRAITTAIDRQIASLEKTRAPVLCSGSF